jgi:hypothetical protein
MVFSSIKIKGFILWGIKLKGTFECHFKHSQLYKFSASYFQVALRNG